MSRPPILVALAVCSATAVVTGCTALTSTPQPQPVPTTDPRAVCEPASISLGVVTRPESDTTAVVVYRTAARSEQQEYAVDQPFVSALVWERVTEVDDAAVMELLARQPGVALTAAPLGAAADTDAEIRDRRRSGRTLIGVTTVQVSRQTFVVSCDRGDNVGGSVTTAGPIATSAFFCGADGLSATERSLARTYC